MELQMYLNGTLVEEKTLPFNAAININYLKFQMEEKYEELIEESNVSPIFIISGIPSRMNNRHEE